MKNKKKNTTFARQNKIVMNPEKITQLKEKALSEAERYYDDAKTMLSEKSGKQGDYYSDAKTLYTSLQLPHQHKIGHHYGSHGLHNWEYSWNHAFVVALTGFIYHRISVEINGLLF